MKIAGGPRPLAIWVFAITFFSAAFIRLIEGLSNISASSWRLAGWLQELAQSNDAVIVALFTEFSIALIPIAWIFLFANRVARWLVLGFGLLKLWGFTILLQAALSSLFLPALAYAEPLFIMVALASLFAPGANNWLRRDRIETHPETLA